MGTRIYLDYQASTPVDPRVLERMLPFFGDIPGNPHSEHAFGWDAQAAINHANQAIADELGCDPVEVVFTSGATESNNLAILGAVRRAPPSRKRLLVGAAEHKCVLEAAHIAHVQYGMTVEQLPVAWDGSVSADTLRSSLDEDVLLVSVMAVNNEIGTLQPLGGLAAACHEFGALFHTDGTHALTAGKVDLCVLDCDLFSLSSHKLYGPKGIGALCVRHEIRQRIEPLIYGGGQQMGLRSGTLPVPLCVGFGEAVRLLSEERSRGELSRIRALRAALVSKILALNCEFSLNGPRLSDRHPANANICFRGYEASQLLGLLQPVLAVSTGSACTSGNIQTSHVLNAIGLSAADAKASLRFGVGRYTTESEIELAVAALSGALMRYV